MSSATKPPGGHWSYVYPELGRGPVSLKDCVSPEFYEKERGACLQEDLALCWLCRTSAEAGQLLHTVQS